MHVLTAKYGLTYVWRRCSRQLQQAPYFERLKCELEAGVVVLFKAWLVYCLKDLMWDSKLSNVALTRHLFVSYTSYYKGTRVHLLVVLAPTLRLAYCVCILVRTYCILVLILVIEPKTVSVVSYTNYLCIYSQYISSVSSSVWNPRN